MARLLRALRQDPERQGDCGGDKADAVVGLDWAKVSKRMQSLARQWAELEFFPRMNGEDVNEVVMPLLQVIEQQGCARLYWKQEEGNLVCWGYLTGESSP